MLLRFPPRGGCSFALAVLLPSSNYLVYNQTDAFSLQEAIGLTSPRSANAETSRTGVQSALDTAVVAAQLPDPVLKFSVGNVPADGSDRSSIGTDFMTTCSVSVMQELTRTEKRRARAERFNAEIFTAEIQHVAVLVVAQRSIAQAWLNRQCVAHAIQLLAEQIVSVALQVEAAETAYRDDHGSHADIVAAHLERQQLQNRIGEARATEASTKTMLRRWVSDASSRPPATPSRLDVPQWLDALDDAATDILSGMAATSAQAAMADTGGHASHTVETPDVTIELMYSQCGPVYASMVSLNISLPILWDQKNHQNREVSAKPTQANAARAQVEILWHNMVDQILGRRETLRLNRRRLDRYQTTAVPLAHAQTEAVLTPYRTGNGSLAAVVEASRETLDLALERLRLEVSTAQLRAEPAFPEPLPTVSQPAFDVGVQPWTEPPLRALRLI